MRNTVKFSKMHLSGAALLTVGALLLSSCSGSSKAEGSSNSTPAADGTLSIGLLNDIGQAPDPDVFYAGNGLVITTNVYEGLVRYARGNVQEAPIEPLLAESWENNEDFTEFTFKLREGVTFHDGTPFTAEAVKASFERRAAVNAGPAYMVADVTEVEIIDDYNVKVSLAEPNSSFLDYLASPYGPRMLSPEILKNEAGDDNAKTYLSTADAGTGPYILSKAVVGEGYELTYYDGYWNDTDPAFTKIELPVYTEMSAMQLELENGDLDVLFGAPNSSRQGYVDSDKLDAYSLSSFQIGVTYFNPNRELFATKEARQAVFNGIDWKTIVPQITPFGAEYSEGYYPTGSLPVELDKHDYEYDPAGLESWVSSLPAGTKIQIGTSAGSVEGGQLANIIAAQLQALGMDATVSEHQSSEMYSTFFEKPEESPDMLVAPGTWPDSNSPYMHGHVFWDPDGGLNFLQCSDEKTTKLLKEALVSGSDETYLEAAQAQQDAMCAPTFARISDFVVAQDWIGNVEDSHSIAAPYTLDLNTLTVEK